MNGSLVFNLDFLVPTLISLGAIAVSIISIIKSEKTALKVSSKEHDMSENLKYVVLKIISIVRAIDIKAAYYQKELEKEPFDYKMERESLIKIQSSPEYLLFLKSINDNDDRLEMEGNIRFLSEPLNATTLVREVTHKILNNLEKQVNLDKMIQTIGKDYQNQWNNIVSEFCKMEGTYTIYNKVVVDAGRELFKRFMEYLLFKMNITDPDVKLIYGAWMDDMEMVELALNSKADKGVTVNKIYGKYPKQRDECYRIVLAKFYEYILTTKVDDYDVQYIYGLKTSDEPIINDAINKGANKNVTDDDIVNKYPNEFYSFLKSYKWQ